MMQVHDYKLCNKAVLALILIDVTVQSNVRVCRTPICLNDAFIEIDQPEEKE